MPQAESRRAREALIAKLRDILPRQFVLTETEQLRPYECDGLTAYRQLPWIVVLPSNGDEVEKILGVCTAHGVPVVARGAGTGLSGGALPHPHGVLLSMTRFDRILSVDRANRTARVQPGVRNIAISEEVESLGLYYAPDPSSQIACSIGGNVAENSGGVHCLKYGLTVHNILKLEVVLMSGEPVTIGADALDMPGYDLLALMTGSEGMLGVVTEITVRLLPKPTVARVILAAFDDLAVAGNAVAAIIGAGIYYGSWWGVIGVVPVLTGVISWCPAYVPFGWSTRKTETSTEQ